MQPTSSFTAPLGAVLLHGTTPYAEASVERDLVTIDVWLPDIDPSDLEVRVTRRSLRLVCVHDEDVLHVGLEVPVPVRAGRYVLRWSNGVYEIRLERHSA